MMLHTYTAPVDPRYIISRMHIRLLFPSDSLLSAMRFSPFIYLLELAASIGFVTPNSIKPNTPESIQKAFIQAGLVPDVLSSFNPVLLLDVTYTIPDTDGEIKVVSPPGRNFTMPRKIVLFVFRICRMNE